MANNILLVPIQADSLFLKEDTLLSEPLADFSRLPFFNGKRDVNPDVAYVSENFVSPPLQNQNLRFRKGLHLHWALPGAYAQGIHTEGANAATQDDFQYPAVPDRWFIHRELDGKKSSWLVESNFLWPDENIYADLTEANEALKKAVRLVRAFEALPDSKKNAVQISRMREVLQALQTCAGQLENYLVQPEYAFFEALLVQVRAWIYRLQTAENHFEAGKVAPDLVNLKSDLAHLLHDFFNRRKDSIAFPMTPGAVRAPRDIDPALTEIKPLITHALRTANQFLSLWEAWTSGSDNRTTDLEDLKNELVPNLKNELLRWLHEPDSSDSTKWKFLDKAREPHSTPTALADFENRILAVPIALKYEDSLDHRIKSVSYPRFHRFTKENLRELSESQRSGLQPWPTILFIKKAATQPAETLQVSVFKSFTDLHDTLNAKTNIQSADIAVVADTLLNILKSNATKTLAPRVQQPFRHLGRTVPRSGNPYREDTSTFEYLAKLTAVGYGEPSFSAFYPNCHSVFGFQDTEIQPGGQPTYDIVGWHDRQEDAFLAYWQHSEPEMPLAKILAEKVNWQLPEGADEVHADTQIALFARLEHGALGTSSNTQPETLAPQATVTLANTGREALAALLAHQVAAEVPAAERAARIAKLEDQLESIFFMDDLDQQQLDIGPRFREARHAQGFNAEPGERLYEIKLENVEIAGNADSGLPAAPKLPAEIAALLQELNSRMQAFDQACFRRDALREQLFVDWYKYMLCAYPPQDSIVDYPDMDEVLYFIEQYDMQPLRDLMFQTGQFPAHPNPGELPNYHQNLMQAFQALQTDTESSDSALQRQNRILAADIQRTDLTDWARIIHLLSQPMLPDALQPLFGELLGSTMGKAILHFQQLKRDALTALNAGWPSRKPHVLFFLGRFGATPEAPDDAHIGHDHIHNWNGLLALLHQRNTSTVQAHADALKNDTGNPNFDANLAAYFQGPSAHSTALEPGESNTETMLEALRAVVGSGANAEKNRKKLAEALPTALRSAPRFALKLTSGPRFWQPKEPTVLIAGDIARGGKRFDTDDTTALEIKPWQVAEIPGGGLPEILAHIEANKPATSGTERGYCFSGGAPWNPFLLEWSVELCPLQEHSNARDGEYQPDYVLHHYELPVNAVDLQEKGSGRTIRGRNPNIYLGRSFLTAQAFRSMEDKLKPYLAENTKKADTLDDPVAAAEKADAHLQELRGKILAQSLSGFNAAMLMLQENFQLPVDDPIGFGDYQKFTTEVSRLIGNCTLRAPNPLTDFSPIRTGKLLINKLRLVDTFGRVADLPMDTGHVLGSSLGAVADGEATDNGNPYVQIDVPPRLAQPARLHFRWLSAASVPELPGNLIPESVNAPSATPVCGWLMANQLDRSMVVFDARGLSLGAVDADGDRVRWRPAPGWESLANPADIENPHLRKVVAYLLQQSGSFMEKFMDGTNDVLRTVEPETFEQQQALALLMGRPMAVVRANIDLELKGIAAVHHGWNAFYRDRKDGTPERETDGYMDVRFPIRIGAVDQLNDGLVGYWLENQDAELAGNFYLNHAATANADPAINYLDERNTPISQSLAPDEPDQTVCMLLDPRASVHAFSGILPTKVLDIPAEQYLDALQSIDITFLTTPVLTPAERISVPHPLEDGFEWQWMEQTAVKSAATDKGSWIEIRSYPTMPESQFMTVFSGMLFDQLQQTHWLDGDKKALPSDKRPPLAPQFARLNPLLNSQMPTDEAIGSGIASALRVADFYPVSRVLLENVLLHNAVRWLEPAPTEGPEKVYRIVPKEQRKGSDFEQVPTNPEFAGFESRVDAILNTAYLGFRAAAEPGQFFAEQVWIREGWLKLKKIG